MKLLLNRIYKGDSYTIGKLYIDGEYFCDTIEDTVRDLPEICPNTPKGLNCQCSQKIYAETAIPSGEYKVTLEHSPRFKKILPRLHGVPHFLGILIHAGNTEKDSAGCIIVGNNTVKGKVLQSNYTLNKLMDILLDGEDITISIV